MNAKTIADSIKYLLPHHMYQMLMSYLMLFCHHSLPSLGHLLFLVFFWLLNNLLICKHLAILEIYSHRCKSCRIQFNDFKMYRYQNQLTETKESRGCNFNGEMQEHSYPYVPLEF